MPSISPVLANVTTINYTLEWPHLENPSNTTFAGATQIDICSCGSKNTDLGHIYTRYRCSRPKIQFASPNEELWVLQAPLGPMNLLRPAEDPEVQRRKEVGEAAEPTAYAGKNFLLLTGPCPRGRYQAYATLQFLRSLAPLARQNIEYLSLLIQPYEEDCADDQGGRAYVELARYILEEVPAFKSLYLNIWGEETRIGSREFAMLLWREGVTIVINWDWWGESVEEYTDIAHFLHGIDAGVVVKRPVWETRGDEGQQDEEDEEDNIEAYQGQDATRHARISNLGRLMGGVSVKRRHEGPNVVWEEVPRDYEGSDDGTFRPDEEDQSKHDDEYSTGSEEGTSLAEQAVYAGEEVTTPTRELGNSEDDWSDALMTPLSPAGGAEDSGWQVL
jgi:hypothetical protein